MWTGQRLLIFFKISCVKDFWNIGSWSFSMLSIKSNIFCTVLLLMILGFLLVVKCEIEYLKKIVLQYMYTVSFQ